ncbi:MAG TPA: hypothetical protein VMG41_02175 [Gemmatimonadales bacterium]|nr:hypothetical protein [Gemmatimonadales bacterium]
MSARSDFRDFLYDLALLLGLPALAIVGLLMAWRPWAAEPEDSVDPAPTAGSVRVADWRGLRIEVPDRYFLTPALPALEIRERKGSPRRNGTWPGRMVLLDLDSLARARFQAANDNCTLSALRCWSDTVDGHAVECHRSGGLPDPTVSWTPHLECQSPDLRVRALINAPQNTTLELVAIFERALSTYSTTRAADARGLEDSARGPVPDT